MQKDLLCTAFTHLISRVKIHTVEVLTATSKWEISPHKVLEGEEGTVMSQALLGPWPGACSQPGADETSADSVTEGSL